MIDKKRLGICIAIIVGAWIICSSFAHNIDRSQNSEATKPVNEVAPAASPSDVGSTARVASPGQPGALLCHTLDANEALTKAAIAQDKYGVGELIASGLVFSVPTGTRVLVIDMQAFVRNVRVMEGKHAGETGWIEPEFLVSAK